MIQGLLHRAVRYLLQPPRDRGGRGDTEITEVIEALERRLSELRRALEAAQQARWDGREAAAYHRLSPRAADHLRVAGQSFGP